MTRENIFKFKNSTKISFWRWREGRRKESENAMLGKSTMHVCVCVCVCERDKEREKITLKKNKERNREK